MVTLQRLCLAGGICLLLTACGQQEVPGNIQASKPTTQVSESAEPKTLPTAQAIEQDMKQVTVTLYYADEQATMLKEVARDITVDPKQSKYEQVYLQLTKSDQPELVALWEDKSVPTFKLSNHVLSIDFATQKMLAQGSATEQLMLRSLLQTFFQFSEVTKIQLLQNGTPMETLGGHIETEKPFTRAMIKEL